MRRKDDFLKMQQGTFRKDRAAESLEVKPGIPVCPVDLSDDAKIIWDDLCEKLVDLKVSTSSDGYVLAMFCETFARWNGLRKFLQENGDSYISRNSLHKIRPEVQSLKECLNSLDVLTTKLCLSPHDRGKLTLPKTEDTDPLELFLRKGKGK